MATVKYYGALAEMTNTRQETLEGKNISALLRMIGAEHGRAAALKARRCHIVVNGCNAGTLRGFSTPVGEKDEVIFLPVCGGG